MCAKQVGDEWKLSKDNAKHVGVILEKTNEHETTTVEALGSELLLITSVHSTNKRFDNRACNLLVLNIDGLLYVKFNIWRVIKDGSCCIIPCGVGINWLAHDQIILNF
jgi:hypothetical protein